MEQDIYIYIADEFYPSFTKPVPISVGSLNAAIRGNHEIISSPPTVAVLGNPFDIAIYVDLNKGIERQVFLKAVIIRKLSDNSIFLERKINRPLISETQNNKRFFKINNLYLPSTDLGIGVILEIDGVEERNEYLNFKFIRNVHRENQILAGYMGV